MESSYILHEERDNAYTRLMNELVMKLNLRKQRFEDTDPPFAFDIQPYNTSNTTVVSETYSELPSLIMDKDTGFYVPRHDPRLSTIEETSERERESENTGYPMPPERFHGADKEKKLCCKCVIS